MSCSDCLRDCLRDFTARISCNNERRIRVATWSKKTSLHGAEHAFSNCGDQTLRSTWCGRPQWRDFFCGWKLLFFAAVVGTIISLSFLFVGYFKNASEKVVTNISFQSPEALTFPDVTFCHNGKPNFEDSVCPKESNLGSPPFRFVCFTFRGNETCDSTIEPLPACGVFQNVTTPFGTCCRFHTEEQVTLSGVENGLRGGLRWTGQSRGLFVFVTNPETRISEQLPHVNAGAGKETFVGVQRAQIKRVDNLLSKNCKKSADSRQNCRADCLYKEILRLHKCRSLGDRDALQSYCICNNNQDLTFRQQEDALAKCSCARKKQVPCEETVYSMRASDSPLVDPDNFFGFVDVNYDSIQIQKIVDEPKKSWDEFLADIGGILGIFLGCSAITIVELCFLCRTNVDDQGRTEDPTRNDDNRSEQPNEDVQNQAQAQNDDNRIQQPNEDVPFLIQTTVELALGVAVLVMLKVSGILYGVDYGREANSGGTEEEAESETLLQDVWP